LSQFDLLNIFVESPGDALFYLIILVLSLGSLLMSVELGRSDQLKSTAQRYSLALIAVAIALAILIIGAITTSLPGQDANIILPPLERAITVSSIIFVGWVLLTADHIIARRISNVIVLLLVAILIIGYIWTGIQWAQVAAARDFNLTNYGVIWTFAPVILSLIGALLTVLLFQNILDAPLKLVYFLVIFAGYGGALLQTMQGDLIGNFAGTIRLGFVASLAIIPLILNRLALMQLQVEETGEEFDASATSAHLAERDSLSELALPARQTTSTARPQAATGQSNQLLRALGLVLENANPADMNQQVVQTAMEVLRADVAALLRLQDANYADIVFAFDQVMQRTPSGMSLNLDDQPTLVNALERQVQRVLLPDVNQDELEDLYTRLDVEEQIGPVYLQPLAHRKELLAVLVIAFPYTERELRNEESELLKGFAIMAGSLLALSYQAVEAQLLAEDRAIQAMIEGVSPGQLQDNDAITSRKELQSNLQQARNQIKTLDQQVSMLQSQLDNERNRIASLLGNTEEELSISQRITAITDEQEQLRVDRDRLVKRLQEAEAALRGATASNNETVMQDMLDVLHREKENLEAEKQRLQQELDDLRAQDRTLVPEDIQRLLSHMSEEKTGLEQERAQLSDKLDVIRGQLQELGIEDDITGLSQWIRQLNDERTTLREQKQLLQQERDTLLRERERIITAIDKEKDRDQQIARLKAEVENLAADRESVMKQRNKLRNQRDELSDKLNAVKEHRAKLLAQTSGYEIELGEAREEQIRLHKQLQVLADERSELISSQDALLASNQALQTERDQLLAQLDGDPVRLQEVSEIGVGSLKDMIDGLSVERDRLEKELNQTRRALADVENQLGSKALSTKNGIGNLPTYHPQQPDLLVGLVQELRTPMTSISGYVSLLLGESAGILGEMQRKFLHRVAANISRLDSMIDSLVNVTELDTGQYRLQPRPINIVNVVEEAITNASVQFREKGLTVNLNLQDDLPYIDADKDAVNQIIGQLLTNAYLASPADSEISVSASQRQLRLADDKPAQETLYVTVEDRGGGIQPEDVPRVFSRKYRADNPLIQGLGDTGVGMSIAKALVERHNGRLWVESKSGIGSVFSFAIPLNPSQKTEVN